MKKAFGQTVREFKREVNKKILNVPGIEQKVLDATSNEPWGPHGSLLADIAMATRSSQEYQTVMAVIWKRINDTGKNWRHVYKALTILDYLVAHGSERVIDEIREHAHQISTLSDFRYIDSCGRDQGNNVRKKSQNLVALVNDKERIIEVRQKAIANKERFRNTPTGGIHRSVSGGYDGRYDYDRYGSKNVGQYGYGRDREFFYKDDGQYGRYGDSKRKDGDCYGRDYEDRYSIDVYRDDEYRGRSASIDDYKYDRSRRCNINHAFDEDDALSRGARANYRSPDGRPLERKFSEQNIGAPPSYEGAVSETQSPVHGERDGETSVSTAPKVSPPTSNNPNQTACDFGNSASPPIHQVEAFDAFDPRSSFSATPTTTTVAPAPANVVQTASTNAEVHLIDALSDALAIVPTTAETVVAETDALANHPTSNVENQHFDDPFGDGPFKAFSSPDVSPARQQSLTYVPTMNQNANTCSAPNVPGIQHPSTNCHFLPQEMSTPTQESHILADILRPSGYADVVSSHATSFSAPVSQSAPHIATYGSLAQPCFYCQQSESGANMYSKPTYTADGQPTQPSANPYGQPRQASSNADGQTVQPSVNPYCQPAHLGANPYGQPAHPNDNPYTQPVQLGSKNTYVNFNSHTAPLTTQIPGSVVQSSHGSCISQNQFNAKNSISALGSVVPFASLSSHQTTNVGATFSPGSNTSMAPVSHPSKDKFEPKSAVWADTFSRGLVNLNISGSKTNPLADIGVDFDAINRKEKMMEKHAPATVTSTLTMGKAMGSGSGIGRVGASILRPPVNPMVGFGMGMGMGMTMGMGGGPVGGMGMGGYGSMNQQPLGMNPGMGMNKIAMNPSMGINIGMRQGAPHMPPQTGMPGNYNPMTGSGGYSQKPYGSSYQ